MITLHNTLTVPMRLTDVTLGGVSVLSTVRQELIRSGRLEDADDDLTLLPGEAISIGNPEPKVTEEWFCYWTEDAG